MSLSPSTGVPTQTHLHSVNSFSLFLFLFFLFVLLTFTLTCCAAGFTITLYTLFSLVHYRPCFFFISRVLYLCGSRDLIIWRRGSFESLGRFPVPMENPSAGGADRPGHLYSSSFFSSSSSASLTGSSSSFSSLSISSSNSLLEDKDEDESSCFRVHFVHRSGVVVSRHAL